MSKRILIAFVAFVVALQPVRGQQAPALNTPLTIDPKVKVGTLPNGLHYYIRQNAKPEKRAELRLVVNTGSIEEDNDQRGYAHFIEHMAFNGTTHFKKNELVDYLQSIGLEFGADLNASTSFDETVYNLRVPTDTARILDKGFQVMADWAYGQLFDSAEVVKERGVVLEEWRGSKGAGERMSRQTLPVIFKGTRYIDRIPIGSDTSILVAVPSLLRRYYTEWYRPDLMAVIAVGDFDVAQVEALVQKHFGPMRAPRNPRTRPATPVPDNKLPLVAIATDKEATSSSILVGFKRPREDTKTVGDFRRGLIERIYIGMLNNRMFELTQKPDAPFNSAGMSLGGFIGRDVNAFTLSASVKDGGIERGFEGVLTEIRRADQFGFLQTELDRSKVNILRGYERSNTERETQQHGVFVGSYISTFLYGATPLSIEYTYPLVQQLLPTISIAEVNGLATRWITDENRVIMVQAPQKDGLRTPTEAELLAVFDRASKVQITAYTENVSDAPLLPTRPTAGRVVGERKIADVGVTEWKLSNGARVLIKPTDFKADEILFTGSSDGGHSLVANADYSSAVRASGIIGGSGAGQFNNIELGKKLTGKVAGAGTSISTYFEGVSGSAAPRDLETMLQLVHLRLTQPRVDTAVWLASKQRTLAALPNRGANPGTVFGDTINATLAPNDFRSRPPTAAILEEVDLGRALAIYKDRFADMGDFTFAFVGNVSLDSLKPLVELYLGSLPSRGRKETWKDVSPPLVHGVIDKTVRKGSEQKASTQMYITGSFKYSADNTFILGALLQVLQIRLTETLREQLGGTYSPSAGGGGGKIPREEYTVFIGFDSSPENVDKLTQSVWATIDTLQTRGPTQADVDKVREQYIRSRETAVKQNGYWLGSIASRDESIDSLSKRIADSEARVKNLTPAQIQAAAKLYLTKTNYARFVLLPEK